MKKIIAGTEFTDILCSFWPETRKQPGILCHDLEDEYHDGDCIALGWETAWLKKAEDIAAMYEDLTFSSFTRGEDGSYTVE